MGVGEHVTHGTPTSCGACMAAEAPQASAVKTHWKLGDLSLNFPHGNSVMPVETPHCSLRSHRKRSGAPTSTIPRFATRVWVASGAVAVPQLVT